MSRWVTSGHRALVVAVVSFAAASSAHAQPDIDTQAQQFEPGPAAADVFGVLSPTLASGGAWGFGAMLNYASEPITLQSSVFGEQLSLIEQQTQLDLSGWYGVGGRFEVGVVVPVVARQTFGGDALSVVSATDAATSGLGDIRFVGRTRFVDSGGIQLGLATMLMLPTGDESSFLSSGLSVEPRLSFEYSTPGRSPRILANAGLRIQSNGDAMGSELNDQLSYGAGFVLPFELGAQPVAGTATLVGRVGLGEDGSRHHPLELLLGVRYEGIDDLAIMAGGGPGLSDSFGTPSYRLFVGVQYAPSSGPSRVGRAGASCATGPEDFDDFEDFDDCADIDNDRDGVHDVDDVCPNEPELVNGIDDEDGCPEDPSSILSAGGDSSGSRLPPLVFAGDEDADGITDDEDDCPKAPEDRDQFEDFDGCPDPDNDGDGVADADDACPLRASTVGRADGCPEARFVLRQVEFEPSRARLRASSYEVLDDLATQLAARPRLTRLRVEGYTDSSGSDRVNERVSLKRAEAVMNYLIEKGVSATRLEAKGFGEANPVADNGTKAGRAKNRRVELRILEIDGKPVRGNDEDD
jgi:outer membrane protein OmpA-like peptidoglycan-associated protein